MEAKQQAAKPQAPVRAPFCLRLNALRALACISVIITHVVSFLGLIGKFRSLHYGGHIAVYFFFNLSGYLLSFSFIKEIQRRLNVKKETNKVSACAEKLGALEDQSSQIEIPIEETKNQTNSSLTDLINLFSTKKKKIIFFVTFIFRAKSIERIFAKEISFMNGPLILFLKQVGKNFFGDNNIDIFCPQGVKKVKKSTLVSILCKYLWNRTWRLFPVYFGCWFVLKYFAVEEIPDRNIFPDTTWSDIIMLRAFPGHLWTMRIEMMFYYYVIPFYICALYIGFKLQKEGFETASKAIFMGLAVGLLYGGLLNLRIEESALNPVSKKHRLADMLPPFYFGMLAALANFAIEQKLIARQAAAKTATPQVQRTRGVLGKLEDLPKFVWPVLDKYKYSLIWTAVFTRIIFLNPLNAKKKFTEKFFFN